jgi:hypothetical protein
MLRNSFVLKFPQPDVQVFIAQTNTVKYNVRVCEHVVYNVVNHKPYNALYLIKISLQAEINFKRPKCQYNVPGMLYLQ